MKKKKEFNKYGSVAYMYERFNMLKKALGKPENAFKGKEDDYKAIAGAWYIQGAYGGYQIQENAKGGGCHSITTGFVKKKDLTIQIDAMIKGASFKNLSLGLL